MDCHKDAWQGPELETAEINASVLVSSLSFCALPPSFLSNLLPQPLVSVLPFIVLGSFWFMASSHNLTLLPAGLVF